MNSEISRKKVNRITYYRSIAFFAKGDRNEYFKEKFNENEE